jgi:hypothetical protein
LKIKIRQSLVDQSDLVQPTQAASLMRGIQGVAQMISLAPFELPDIHMGAPYIDAGLNSTAIPYLRYWAEPSLDRVVVIL